MRVGELPDLPINPVRGSLSRHQTGIVGDHEKGATDSSCTEGLSTVGKPAMHRMTRVGSKCAVDEQGEQAHAGLITRPAIARVLSLAFGGRARRLKAFRGDADLSDSSLARGCHHADHVGIFRVIVSVDDDLLVELGFFVVAECIHELVEIRR